MKIVHVIPGFLPEYVAGTEVYCWSVCKYLQRQGISTEVVTPGFGQQQNTEYSYDGIKVTKYAEPAIHTRLHIAGLKLPEGIPAFKEYISQANPDCVHVHGIYGGISITIQHLAEIKALGFPVIYTMHLPGHICATHTLVHEGRELCDGIIRPVRCASCNLIHRNNSRGVAKLMAGMSGILQKTGVDTAYWNNPLGTALSSVNRIVDIQKNLMRLAALCDKVVLYAKWFGEIMVKNGFPAEKMDYVPPALSYAGEPLTPVEPLNFTYKDSLKLIFVGRLDPTKDLLILLQAIKDIPANKIELSIYGKAMEPSYYEACKKLTENKTNIHWRGLYSREELLTIFRQHDMLCLPSAFSEMSPLVIQEAFAAGLPVLASAVYGNAELITHDLNGLLFAFKSLEGLHRQLVRLLEEDKLLENLKHGVSQPLSFDTVAERYIEIYNLVKKTKTFELSH